METMANHTSVLAPVNELHQRDFSISIPPPAPSTSPDLSPRSSFLAPQPSSHAAQPVDAATKRHSGYYSDHSSRTEVETAEETTPRTSFSSESCTPPKQPLRRISGRRALSGISSSSLNSDMSPFYVSLDHSHSEGPHDHHGHHGLGVSYGNVPPGRGIHQTPDFFSPSKHRRHRSMISASIDYRTQYTSPQQFGHPLYVNYTPRPHNDASASPKTCAYHQYSPLGLGYSYGPQTGPYNQCAQPYGTGTYPTPGPSPMFDASPLSATSSLSGPQSPGNSHNDPIQDLFVTMAYKERQVLEARQNLEEATEVLNAFKRKLKAMITPRQEPVGLPCRPTIISRRHCPNVGIHTLAYTVRRPRAPSTGLQIVKWRVDNDVSQALDDEIRDEDDDGLELHGSDGIALRIVKCLLGIVHCIIATFPVHQRDFARHPYYVVADRSRDLVWTAEYPMPMETLFGYLAYET